MFRRNCATCNCDTYHHAAMYNPYNNPADRMCVEEDTFSAIDEARDKGYAWVPRGLSDFEVGWSSKKFCCLFFTTYVGDVGVISCITGVNQFPEGAYIRHP